MRESQEPAGRRRTAPATKSFELRLDPGLHERLKAAAEADDRSLHSMIVRILREWDRQHQAGEPR
jgi:predicted HicB family RNase H-like nuclease